MFYMHGRRRNMSMLFQSLSFEYKTIVCILLSLLQGFLTCSSAAIRGSYSELYVSYEREYCSTTMQWFACHSILDFIGLLNYPSLSLPNVVDKLYK